VNELACGERDPFIYPTTKIGVVVGVGVGVGVVA